MNIRFEDIDKSKIKEKESSITDLLSFRYSKLVYGESPVEVVKLLKKYVCILPFESDDNKKIKNLYLTKEYDLFDNTTYSSAIVTEVEGSLDETNLDCVTRFMNEKMNVNINEDDLEKIFYLGDIEMKKLLKASIPCYAVRVNELIRKKDDTFKICDCKYVVRTPYDEVTKSGALDVFTTTSLYKLLTYFI